MLDLILVEPLPFYCLCPWFCYSVHLVGLHPLNQRKANGRAKPLTNRRWPEPFQGNSCCAASLPLSLLVDISFHTFLLLHHLIPILHNNNSPPKGSGAALHCLYMNMEMSIPINNAFQPATLPVLSMALKFSSNLSSKFPHPGFEISTSGFVQYTVSGNFVNNFIKVWMMDLPSFPRSTDRSIFHFKKCSGASIWVPEYRH